MAKMSAGQFANKVDYWSRHGLAIGTKWQHYKGGVYVIDGYGIDTDTGELRIRYHRIGGPNFDAIAEAGQEFYRPPTQWRETVKALQGSRFVPYEE